MRRLATSFTLGLLLCGCSQATSIPCTDIGSPSGVGVTVEAAVAADVTTLSLRVCWAGGVCRDESVMLSPGSDSVGQGCTGTDPDSVCSATAVPNGNKVGFADIADLPQGKISVGATVTLSGRKKTYRSIDLEASTIFPNGRQCPPGGNQATVTVTADRLR